MDYVMLDFMPYLWASVIVTSILLAICGGLRAVFLTTAPASSAMLLSFAGYSARYQCILFLSFAALLLFADFISRRIIKRRRGMQSK